MSISLWVIVALVLWLLWSWVANWIMKNPRSDISTGFIWHGFQIYSRILHRIHIQGLQNIPTGTEVGPLIVVSNHTAGVDPILIQSACPFFIRWMMALDMRIEKLESFWTWLDIISVDRDGREIIAARQATRQAIGHLAQGGVLGIFPEGTLERPPAHILPFLSGVGLIVRKSNARVLPVIITGTPQSDPAWSSLWKSSRATVRFLEPVSYTGTQLKSAQIAADLRQRLAVASGWPLLDEPDPAAIHNGK